MVSALLMAMVEHYPGLPWWQPPPIHIEGAVKVLSSALIATFVLGLLLARFLPRVPVFKHLMLETEETREAGYQASAGAADLRGMTGTADSPLRPAGIGIFGDERLNVVARGEFIDKGSAIVIVDTHGNRIVVESIENDPTDRP